MKNKKKWVLILCITLSVILIMGFILIIYHNYHLKHAPSSESDLKRLQNEVEMVANDIINLEESNNDIPEFGILLMKDETLVIDKEFTIENGIKLYEFDGSIDNKFDIVKNHYIGIRLTDILEKIDFADYHKIIFASKIDDNESHFVTYDTSAISEKTYIIFSRDGKMIKNDEQPSLITFDYDYRSSVENLTSITLSN